MSRCATVAFEVEDVVERGRVEVRGDLGVGADELAEVALLVPRAHRVALDEPIRLARARGRVSIEREQQPVGEEEAVRGPEVPLHPLRVDDEPVDDPA